MAALINPPSASPQSRPHRLHASLSLKHLARQPTWPPLPSEALTPLENRPVDLGRNIRPFFFPRKMFPSAAREVGSPSPTLACLFNAPTIAQLDWDQLLVH